MTQMLLLDLILEVLFVSDEVNLDELSTLL